jgi:hypothetical protein
LINCAEEAKSALIPITNQAAERAFSISSKANYTKKRITLKMGLRNVSLSHMLIKTIGASNPYYYLGSVPNEESSLDGQQPHGSNAS